MVSLLLFAPIFAVLGIALAAEQTVTTPSYNWLAVPYQMKGSYSSIPLLKPDDPDWENGYGCQMVLQRIGTGYAECWTNLVPNYEPKACIYNDGEEVKYDGLQCKTGFYATYEGFTVIGSAHVWTCNPPPDRPGQKNIDHDNPGPKCDLILNNLGRGFCYYGIEMDRIVTVAEHKQVGTHGHIELWNDTVDAECYFGDGNSPVPSPISNPGEVDCEPYSDQACEVAAMSLGLTLGGGGFEFKGNYQTKGCYTYEVSSEYYGIAFFGLGGTEDDRRGPVSSSDQLRPDGYDCVFPAEAPTRCPSSADNPIELPTVGSSTGATKVPTTSPEEEVECDPFSVQACKIAAERSGLTLGGLGFEFEGDYQTKGCYTYDSSSPYYGHAFFGLGGTEDDRRAPVGSPGQFRPEGYDCVFAISEQSKDRFNNGYIDAASATSSGNCGKSFSMPVIVIVYAAVSLVCGLS